MSITEIEVIKNIIQNQAYTSVFFTNSFKDYKNTVNELIQSEKNKDKIVAFDAKSASMKSKMS
jgi:hypothetical protein